MEGNAAGAVPQGDSLSSRQMQAIARELNKALPSEGPCCRARHIFQTLTRTLRNTKLSLWPPRDLFNTEEAAHPPCVSMHEPRKD
jgi:hypothetical protein